MSGLAVTRTIVLGEGGEAPLAVTVRELTVAEIRTWMADAQEASPDLVSNLLLRGVSLADLAHLSSLTPAQIDSLAPSQLQAVLDVAKEVNTHFFALLAAVGTLARQMQSAASNGPSPA